MNENSFAGRRGSFESPSTRRRWTWLCPLTAYSKAGATTSVTHIHCTKILLAPAKAPQLQIAQNALNTGVQILMIRTLKDLSGLNPTQNRTGYNIIKFWHPDAHGKSSEVVQQVSTLEEAKEICSAPDSSYKEGPTSEWYFLGYSQNDSRTSHIQLWNAGR